MARKVKYPDVHVKLTGKDGNAFFILGTMLRALKANDVPKEEIDEFRDQAMSGDYDHLLATCMEWVVVA